MNPEWLSSDYVHRVLIEVDKNEIHETFIVSKVLGVISAYGLSSGAKGLITMYRIDNYVFNGERFGDNCWKLIFELGEERDIYICLNHRTPTDKLPDKIKFYRENDNVVWEGDKHEYYWMLFDIMEDRWRDYCLANNIYDIAYNNNYELVEEWRRSQ